MTKQEAMYKIEDYMDAQMKDYRTGKTLLPMRRNSNAYKLAVNAVEQAGQKTRVGWSNRNFCKDYQYDVCKILRNSGIETIAGNDAPRAGVNGQYVIVNL